MTREAIMPDIGTAPVPREIAALLAALQLREATTSQLEALTEHEWESLLNFTDRAHMTLQLVQLDTKRFPDRVKKRLAVNVSDNSARFERARKTYIEAADALDRAGIEHIVIKGFTASPEYVPDPRLRYQSDIDLYCPREMIGDARLALQGIGYCPSEMQDGTMADHTPAMIRLGDWKWRGNSFDPEMPLSIELHFSLWNDAVSYFEIPGVEGFWPRRVTRTICGLSCHTLSRVDHLGYLTLHILRNILLRDTILHHVHELASFLHNHAQDDSFWADWAETYSPTMRSFQAIAFYEANAWFGCDLHPQAAMAIASLPSVQHRWLRSFALSPLEGMFNMNKDFLWLHLSYVRSSRVRLKLIRRTLVPTRLATIDSPLVHLDNKRELRTRDRNPYLRYIVYLVSRSFCHGRASMAAVLSGVRWKLSRHQLAREFWIFLFASFFLTWACQSTSFSSISF